MKQNDPAMSELLFAFDLDGTITEQEILPVLGRAAGLGEELAQLTAQTLSGKIAFEESFRRRFHMLRHIPLDHIETLVAGIPLNPHIEHFIQEHREQCVIVSGNLDRWIRPLTERLGCPCYCSRSSYSEKKGLRLTRVLSDKGAVIRRLTTDPPKGKRRIVAVGESISDAPMFRASAVGIAFGGVHKPVPELACMADYLSYDGRDLCSLLRRLL